MAISLIVVVFILFLLSVLKTSKFAVGRADIKVLYFLYIALQLSVIALSVSVITDLVSLIFFKKYVTVLIYLLTSLLLIFTAITIMPDIGPRRIRTLWRVPIIAVLLSLWPALKYYSQVNMVLVAIAFGLCFLKVNELRYLKGKVLPFFLPALYYVTNPNFMLQESLVYFCMFIYLMGPITNICSIKLMATKEESYVKTN